MNITGGQVTFKRNFQPEQYGSKGAEVTIMFVMGDGEELGASLDKVGELVKTKVYELCNLKIEGRAIATPADVKAADLPKGDDVGKANADKTAAAANMTAAEKRAATNAAKKKAEEDAAAAAAAKAKVAEAAKAKVEEQVGEDLGDVFDEEAAGTEPEVSDADLSAANNRAVARLKEKHQGAAPQLIRELIATFVKPPLKTHDIPQNLRNQYLKKLEALV